MEKFILNDFVSYKQGGIYSLLSFNFYRAQHTLEVFITHNS